MIVYIEAEVRAYSPYDRIDKAYHQRHPESKTSTGTDPKSPGIASTFGKGVKCRVPGYCNGDAVLCDDTGSMCKNRSRRGILNIEIRMGSEDEALEWGVKKLRIAVIYP